MSPSWLPQHQTLRAGLFMVFAMGSFVVNDTCVKIVGTSLPVGEIVALRGGLSVLLIAAICVHQGVLPSVSRIASRKVFARAMLDLIATLLFVTALMHMQIANLTAIMQAVPLAVAVLSVLFLGERIGWRRALAIILGFIGVLFIVKPDPAAFTLYDALALTIVFAVAIRDLVTRRIPAKIPTLIVALANAGFVAVGGLLLGLTQGFVMPQPWQIAILAFAAVFLASGYMFMVTTLRLGDLSATAPFRYSIMLFAIVSGIAVFGEIPDSLAIIGMALIVVTGIYAAHRESRFRDISRTPAP